MSCPAEEVVTPGVVVPRRAHDDDVERRPLDVAVVPTDDDRFRQLALQERQIDVVPEGGTACDQGEHGARLRSPTMSDSSTGRLVAAEFVGTAIVMLGGPGLMIVGGDDIGTLGVALGFGVSIAIAIGVIGAVANPMFSLALWFSRGITGRELFADWVGQFVGGVVRCCADLRPQRHDPVHDRHERVGPRSDRRGRRSRDQPVGVR